MNTWNNKIKYFIVAIGIILLSFGSYYAYKHLSTSTVNKVSKENDTEVENIFPDLDEKYYNELLSTKNSEKVITENLVYELLSDLSKRVNLPNGDIYFNWKLISDYELNVYIKIVYQNKEYKKAYKFKLDYSN